MYKIAESKEQFETAEGFVGYIVKRLKRRIDLVVNGAEYALNVHGVLCSRRTLPDGRVWYSYCCSKDELFKSRYDEKDWIETFVVDRDEKGLIFKA